MKVALIGARGIANYGGFETVVAELAPRLRDLGYEVYCSSRMTNKRELGDDFNGVSLVYFPFEFPSSSFMGRFFESLYDWYFALKCAYSLRCQVVYCLGTAGGYMLPFAKLSGATFIVNVDGLEWMRSKFSRFQRAAIKSFFLVSFASADYLLLDNARLVDYIPAKYHWKCVHIPYGVSVLQSPPFEHSVLNGYLGAEAANVSAGGYWLVVARLEPDNNIHTIVQAYLRSTSRKPLLIVGSFSSPEYKAQIESLVSHATNGKRVLFAGSIFNQTHLHMIRCHCCAYIHGHSVGGTNPSLLEAMSASSLIVAFDNVFNREICLQNAVYFRNTSDLVARIDSIENNPENYKDMGTKAHSIAIEKYRWSEVAQEYDQLFKRAKSR